LDSQKICWCLGSQQAESCESLFFSSAAFVIFPNALAGKSVGR
jgi:hypothetical protein